MEKVVIIGGKSSATLVADNIYDAQVSHNLPMEVLGFAYDDAKIGELINGFPVLCKINEAYETFKNDKEVKFVYQMYDIKNMRKAIQHKDSLNIPLDRYFTFIHPSTMLSRSASVGVGTLIMAHCVVNPKARIGQFNSIMSHVTIGHDAQIGHYNLIATHAIISNLKMGDRNFIGINAATNNKISIGHDCMVGMCSNLTKSIGNDIVCYGNPARQVLTEKKLL
jgi:sugar O-acyltransferase (sialic acid O-acetyltransferase NeuD family)